MNGAQALIKALEGEGVKVVFGYPGGAVLPIYDALLHSSIKHILTRGEQAAAHAASGYARSTGKTGVCFATSGPGATNLVTGIANAYLDSTPLVSITGQVASEQIGQDVFQEVDIVGATAPFTKNNYLVSNVLDIPEIVKAAFYIASTGRQGPVLIDIPSDIQKKDGNFDFNITLNIRGYKPNAIPHPMQLKRLQEVIKSSSKPLLCVGGGGMLSYASKNILDLSNRINAPIVTTLLGIGSVPTNYENCLGMIGQNGLYAANRAVSHSDLLLVLGARLGDRATGKRQTFAKNAKIVHIDIDPAEIGKNHDTFLPIVGDLNVTLSQLLEMDIARQDTCGWIAVTQKWKKHLETTGVSGNDGLDPKEIMECISNQTNHDVIVTTDVGQHQIWAGRFYKTRVSGSFITSGGLGTMGFSIPSAVGIAIGNPDKRVIAIVGDGGIQMCLNELATVRQEKLKIGIAIFNNRCLGMVRELQQRFCGGRYNQVHLQSIPDFSLISAAYGIEYHKVTAKNEIDKAVDLLLDPKKLVIVEFVIDPCANVLPASIEGGVLS